MSSYSYPPEFWPCHACDVRFEHPTLRANHDCPKDPSKIRKIEAYIRGVGGNFMETEALFKLWVKKFAPHAEVHVTRSEAAPTNTEADEWVYVAARHDRMAEGERSICLQMRRDWWKEPKVKA